MKFSSLCTKQRLIINKWASLITSQQEKPTERPEHLSLKYSKYCVEYSKYCVTVHLKSVNSLVQHKRPLANSSEYVRMVTGVIKRVLGPFYRTPCALSTYLKVLTRAVIVIAPHQVVWRWFTGHKMFLTFGRVRWTLGWLSNLQVEWPDLLPLLTCNRSVWKGVCPGSQQHWYQASLSVPDHPPIKAWYIWSTAVSNYMYVLNKWRNRWLAFWGWWGECCQDLFVCCVCGIWTTWCSAKLRDWRSSCSNVAFCCNTTTCWRKDNIVSSSSYTKSAFIQHHQ